MLSQRFKTRSLRMNLGARLALYLSLGIGLSSCGPHRPNLTFCLIRADDGLLYCADPKGNEFTLRIDEADKYVCLSSRDQETLLQYVVGLEKKVAQCR